MANAQIESSVKAALGRGDARRETLMRAAKDRFEGSALASGSYAVGRSEDGKPVDTRTALSMGITINGWFVRTVFKRDDAGKLAGRDWRDVEADAKSGDIPTRLVVTENHIITAVRELKHVREGYLSEIEATKAFVGGIIALNLSVANKPHPVSDADISAVVKGLRDARPIIASKDSPLKQIVSVGRMDEAIRKFDAVLSPQCKNRALELGRACAVLTSVPERLTAWRDQRIAGGVAYTAQRESSLRVERDKWVFSQLARYSSSIRRVREFSDEDEKKKGVLNRVEGMLGELEGLAKQLRALGKKDRWSEEAQKALDSAVSGIAAMEAEAGKTPWADAGKRMGIKKEIRNLERRKNRSAEQESRLAEARTQLEGIRAEAMRLPWYDTAARGELRKSIRLLKEKKALAESNAGRLEAAEKAFGEKKSEAMRCLWANAELFHAKTQEPGSKQPHLLGDYGWLHRNIRQEQLGDARAKLEYQVLFLDSNKPRFILDELSQSPDSYLAQVLAQMKPAVAAFEAKDLKTAQNHFAQAALEMRKIVYPEQR